MWSEEETRISRVYEQRQAQLPSFFVFDNYAHCYRAHQRYVETLRLLYRAGIRDLAPLKILDVGCGEGAMLREMLQWGAAPENLAGIDLRADQIDKARRINPAIDYRSGSAAELHWADQTFDLAILHTVFTSILDDTLKHRIAQEVMRVLKSGGAVVWYDFAFDNPGNPHVKGVGQAEITRLFPGCTLRLIRHTLAPPLARRLPSRGFGLLYQLLSLFPFLRTHLLGLLVKKPDVE